MIRISIMILLLWGVEFFLIYRSNKEKDPMPTDWIFLVTLINVLVTAYLIVSEILVLHGK